jgi:integrase
VGTVQGVVADPTGNVYFSSELGCVFKLDTTGTLTRYAGTCRPGFTAGDGGPAASAEIFNPVDLTMDAAGNLYIADVYPSDRIRKVSPSGTITTVAGNGVNDVPVNGTLAVNAALEPAGLAADAKADAEKKRNEFMRTVNGGDPEQGGNRPVLLREFVDQKYLPFQRGKWKKSTRGTSENRIQHHIVKGLGDTALKDFSLTSLQKFLETKADQGLSFSVVDHLRWDLGAMFEMAVAEKLVSANPATRLYTPKNAWKGQTRAMSAEDVRVALEAVELRERVLLYLAIFSGFRPGEMLALQRRHVSADATSVKVQQRVYRGEIDDPKTEPSKREVAIPPQTAELLREWMAAAVGPEAEAFVFAGEKGTPVWRDTLLYDHIRPKLKRHGLEWVDFQVMRATHASIGHRLKLDPKVTADQRGHGVGVAIEEYTKTSLKDRAVAAKKLEEAILGKSKVVTIPRKWSA